MFVSMHQLWQIMYRLSFNKASGQLWQSLWNSLTLNSFQPREHPSTVVPFTIKQLCSFFVSYNVVLTEQRKLSKSLHIVSSPMNFAQSFYLTVIKQLTFHGRDVDWGGKHCCSVLRGSDSFTPTWLPEYWKQCVCRWYEPDITKTVSLHSEITSQATLMNWTGSSLWCLHLRTGWWRNRSSKIMSDWSVPNI